jgi:hypothetical protein
MHRTREKVRTLGEVAQIENIRRACAANMRLVLKAQDGTLPRPGAPASKGQASGGSDYPVEELMGNISLGDTHNTTTTGLGRLGTAALGAALLLGGGGLGLGLASLLGGRGEPPPVAATPGEPSEPTSPQTFEDTTFDLRLAQ